MSITTAIKSIQDIMRKDVGVDGDAQRIGQLVWMLFLKVFDDRETEWELFDDGYRSPLPEDYRWRNWAADPEGMTGEELMSFIDNELFPTLQSLGSDGVVVRPVAHVIRSVFEDAYNYMKSGQLLRQVLNKIQESVDFNKAQERHAFGDMYEQLLRDLQNAGNAGEFYTPRPVTEFMVRRVDPKLAETVMDPACGTGGFLTCAIEHKRRRHVKTPEDEAILQASIFGVEKKPLPHLLATTNMILHGIEVPSQIRHDNTLAKPLTSWGTKDRVDCIIANPPFGGMEEDGIEDGFPAAFQTRETADLFMVLIMHLLKSGGRAAVVLPDGFLFGEGIKSRIKEKLLTECNLHTVVRLPNGVFSPYTGIKTNLLFFTKGEPTTEVWFYEHPYPAGVKNYSKTRPMRIEEFAAEEAWWGDRQATPQAWKIDFGTRIAQARAAAQPHWDEAGRINSQAAKLEKDLSELKRLHAKADAGPDGQPVRAEQVQALQARCADLRAQARAAQAQGDQSYWPVFNLDCKNPHVGETVSHDPEALLREYARMQAEIAALRDQLKGVLAEALERDAKSRLVTDHLPLLMGTPNGVKKLRELILELAVRGKRVAQDQGDEPAGELLSRISAEKAKLVREGQVRQGKPLPQIDASAVPFEIPCGWIWSRLGSQVIESSAGWSPSCETQPRSGTDWGVLKVSAVSWGVYKPEENKALPQNLEPRPEHEVKIHDFLVSRANTAELVARSVVVETTPEHLMLSDKIIRLKLTSQCNRMYINFVNSAPFARYYYGFSAGGTSGSMKNVSREQILSLPIPLAPLAEQHRIVAKVDELMVLCDQIEAGLTQLQYMTEILAQALVKHATR